MCTSGFEEFVMVQSMLVEFQVQFIVEFKLEFELGPSSGNIAL